MSAPLLVGDLGGTNARFAVAEREGDRVRLLHRATLRTHDFESVEAAAGRFLDGWEGARPRRAVFAVAGPVEAEIIAFTNAAWTIRRAGLAERLGVDAVAIVNDFAAMALGAVHAEPAAFAAIKPGEAVADAPVVVTGPGTGLGLAVVHRLADEPRITATEGGHAAFAPRDDKEIEVLKFIRREFDYVSFERILSGQGLVVLHRALCAVDGRARVTLAPEDVTAAALAKSHPVAVEAARMFCNILGAFAGDVALIHGARGGVVLADILPRPIRLGIDVPALLFTL
ncbi:MAG: glucokinase, partial [Parvularculaceae bacterium]|nr:glucokinase [Parvularculaceae bacterium]